MLKKQTCSMILGMFVFLPVLISARRAVSEEKIAQNIDCKNAIKTEELKLCAAQLYQAADKELNQVYEKVISGVSGEQKQKLIDAQQAWIKFRDGSCDFKTYSSRDGREYPIYRDGCLTNLTEQRTKDLKEYLSVKSGPPAETQPSKTLPVSSLPDGNYRYVTAQLSSKTVTDEELVQAGGFYFLFRKKGNQIVGYYNQIDSGNTICIDGKVNGNTVTGQAVETSEPPFNPKETVISTGEQFVKWDLAQHLDVRRGQKVGNKIRYRSALLNLSSFNRINAGTQVPPQRCQ